MLARLFLLIRSLVFYIGYYSGTVFISTFFILLFPVLPPKGRHVVASIWCSFVLEWLRLCCGVRYVVHGLENLPKTPAIILANHQSSWETILFYKLVFPVSPAAVPITAVLNGFLVAARNLPSPQTRSSFR